MDLPLKGAILISVIIHAFFIMPFHNLDLKDTARVKKPLTVNYYIEEEPKPVVRPSLPVRDVKITETPRVNLAKKVETKPSPTARAETAKEKSDRSKSEEDALKQARIKSTKDYINYYSLIREKIRQRLKVNYKSFYAEGDVRLAFTLDRNGALSDVHIEDDGSVADKGLRDISAASVREASPFPTFPRALSLPKMSFNLIVTFKKR